MSLEDKIESSCFFLLLLFVSLSKHAAMTLCSDVVTCAKILTWETPQVTQ